MADCRLEPGFRSLELGAWNSGIGGINRVLAVVGMVVVKWWGGEIQGGEFKWSQTRRASALNLVIV